MFLQNISLIAVGCFSNSNKAQLQLHIVFMPAMVWWFIPRLYSRTQHYTCLCTCFYLVRADPHCARVTNTFISSVLYV